MSKEPTQTWQFVKPDTDFILKYQLRAAATWMADSTIPCAYMDEYLPGLFSRTIRAKKFVLKDGSLEWIFTGPQGGFTITVKPDSISLVQRHYDSIGLYDADKFIDQDPETPLSEWFDFPMSKVKDGQAPFGTYPQKKWFHSTMPYQDEIATLQVSIDYKNALRVLVNGEELLRQTCHLDIHRHQIKLADSEGLLDGRVISPGPKSIKVSVDRNNKHQKMIGFGGTNAPTAYAQFSEEGKQKFWNLLAEYNLLIHRENPIGPLLKEDFSNFDDLSQASPHYYGDNFPNGNISDFEINRRIKELGGQIWFEFWDFPHWVMADRDGEFYDDNNRQRKGIVDIKGYTRAMVGYCKISLSKIGYLPDMLGIQNEQSQSAETYHNMTLTLRRELDAAGFNNVKIQMQDANMLSNKSTWGKLYSNGINRAKSFTSNRDAWSAVDYAATHMYDYQEYFNNPDAYDQPMTELRKAYGDKPFISPELAINNGRYQMKSYRLALLMGMLYHKNLTILDAKALLYCWTILDVEQTSFASTRALFAIDRSNNFVPVSSGYQLRVFGAYSRRTSAGMVRVDVNSGDPDVLTVGFTYDKAGDTLVLMNRSSNPVDAEVEPFYKFAEITDQYHQNMVCNLESIQSKPGTVRIEPGAIVTLSNVELRTHHIN